MRPEPTVPVTPEEQETVRNSEWSGVSNGISTTTGGAATARVRSGEHLTPREFEVLALIANGKSSKEIAATLGIAFKTVVCHRGRILSKLGFHNAADLTRYAVRIGLINP